MEGISEDAYLETLDMLTEAEDLDRQRCLALEREAILINSRILLVELQALAKEYGGKLPVDIIHATFESVGRDVITDNELR